MTADRHILEVSVYSEEHKIWHLTFGMSDGAVYDFGKEVDDSMEVDHFNFTES